MNLTQENARQNVYSLIITNEALIYPENFDNNKKIWFGVITQLIRDILSNSMKKENISIKKRAIKWLESDREMIEFISDILEIDYSLLIRYVLSSINNPPNSTKNGRL